MRKLTVHSAGRVRRPERSAKVSQSVSLGVCAVTPRATPTRLAKGQPALAHPATSLRPSAGQAAVSESAFTLAGSVLANLLGYDIVVVVEFRGSVVACGVGVSFVSAGGLW